MSPSFTCFRSTIGLNLDVTITLPAAAAGFVAIFCGSVQANFDRLPAVGPCENLGGEGDSDIPQIKSDELCRYKIKIVS